MNFLLSNSLQVHTLVYTLAYLPIQLMTEVLLHLESDLEGLNIWRYNSWNSNDTFIAHIPLLHMTPAKFFLGPGQLVMLISCISHCEIWFSFPLHFSLMMYWRDVWFVDDDGDWIKFAVEKSSGVRNDPVMANCANPKSSDLQTIDAGTKFHPWPQTGLHLVPHFSSDSFNLISILPSFSFLPPFNRISNLFSYGDDWYDDIELEYVKYLLNCCALITWISNGRRR